MDVRRQARLTAAIPPPPSPCGPLPSLVGASALAPVPSYLPTYSAIAAPHVQQVVHGEEAGYAVSVQGTATQQGSLRQHQAAAGRRGDGRLIPGVADLPIRKDRRKDRHKRASDGRNPMIRLNPSTADRFFAVQRLLESKRLKKTSGSFVINWLIDVAHASIQAVLEQGAESEQRGQQLALASAGYDPAQAHTQQQQHLDSVLEDHKASDLQLGQSVGPSSGAPSSQGYLAPVHLQPQHGAEIPQELRSLAGPRSFPGSAHSLSVQAQGEEDEEEELLVEDTDPQVQPVPLTVTVDPTQQGHSYGQIPGGPALAHHPPHLHAQLAYTAADIARTAMAAAEAAEADGDDEDEDVDVVADGDGYENPSGLQRFGLTHSDIIWMRTGTYPYRTGDGQQGGEAEEDADAVE